MTRDKGGPAFPTHLNPAPGRLMNHLQGMTLEDYFAGEALMGAVAREGSLAVSRDRKQAEVTAVRCYNIAAAMVAEREKRNAEG